MVTRETDLATEVLPDVEIVVASLSEPERFAEIFERHFAAIHGYLVRRAGVSSADDLASQVFVVAFERRASVRADSTSVRPWLYGIATNLLRNDARAERRRLFALARLQNGSEHLSTLPESDATADRGRIASLLAKLDPDHRDALLLHVWEELSYAEIALALGIPAGTVASRIARSRKRLRMALEESEGFEETAAGRGPARGGER